MEVFILFAGRVEALKPARVPTDVERSWSLLVNALLPEGPGPELALALSENWLKLFVGLVGFGISSFVMVWFPG